MNKTPEIKKNPPYELVFVYVKEHKGLKNLVLPVSKKYSVKMNDLLFNIQKDAESSYPENFHNIIAMVGKNGVGKTSYLEVLKSLLDKTDEYSENSFVVFKNTDSNEFVYVGDINPNMRITFEGKETQLRPIGKDELGYYLISVNDGRYSEEFTSMSATEQLYRYYQHEMKSETNIFTIFGLPTTGRVVLDLSPVNLDKVKPSVIPIQLQLPATVSEINEFYEVLNDELGRYFLQNKISDYVKILYLKYLTIKVVQSLNAVKSRDIDFVLERIASFQKYIDEDNLSRIAELTSEDPQILSYGNFQSLIGDEFFRFTKDSEEKLNTYINNIKSMFGNFVFRLDFDQMSSGQDALLQKLSTIYNGIEDAKGYKRQSIVILIDEIDMFIHPEWERVILLAIQNLVSKSGLFCELIFSTHSPITLSDLQAPSVIYIEDLKTHPEKRLDFNPFMQNIHLILRNPFFLKDTQGALGKKYVESIVTKLTELEKKPLELTKAIATELESKIQDIGEVIIRERLRAKLNLIAYGKFKITKPGIAEKFLEELDS